jgi:uncharacterized protein YbjT (DUF2867 family)
MMETMDRAGGIGKGVSPVLVLGGTGYLGRRIVRSLRDRGQSVRVLSRNGVRARQILGDGVEILVGDITSQESVVAALDGVRAMVISVSAFSPQLIRQLKRIEHDAVLIVLEQARKARVSRVVYISTYDVREDATAGLSFEVARLKLAIETALARLDFNWTVLGAAPSMGIFFAMIRGDRMMVPGGGPPALPAISRVDVGEIAAQAVLRDDLAGRRIRMVGPESLSFPEAAERISAVVGRTVEFRKIPLLPLRVVAALTRPFNPYLSYMLSFVTLMKRFPPDLVAQASDDHRLLVETFSYAPTTVEMEAQQWLRAA